MSEISDENHPVEVGLSDAFYVDVPLSGSGGPSELASMCVVNALIQYNHEHNYSKIVDLILVVSCTVKILYN